MNIDRTTLRNKIINNASEFTQGGWGAREFYAEIQGVLVEITNGGVCTLTKDGVEYRMSGSFKNLYEYLVTQKLNQIEAVFTPSKFAGMPGMSVKTTGHEDVETDGR